MSTTRRVVLPGSALTNITCARKGCQKKITYMAQRNGDPYCSRPCAMGEVKK